MLTIRPPQLAVLGQATVDRFVDKTWAALPEVFPGDPRLADEPAMRAQIREGIAGAAGHGITGGREVTLYVFLLIEHGPGFEDAPKTRWMGKILRDPELHDAAKLDLIYARLGAGKKG